MIASAQENYLQLSGVGVTLNTPELIVPMAMCSTEWCVMDIQSHIEAVLNTDHITARCNFTRYTCDCQLLFEGGIL